MNLIKSTFAKLASFPLGLFKKSKRKVSKSVRGSSESPTIIDTLKSTEIRKKLLFTFAIIVIYRVLTSVPLPGVNVALFNETIGNSPVNNFFTVITGGRLDNPSIVAIGLGAYINASIILQLLQTVIPKLEELSKEGERGRQTINQYTRLLSIPLAVIQSFVIYTILINLAESVPQLSGIVADINTFDIVTMIVALTAGSVLLMWLGELISEYGIGNGVSIIISLGILSALPGLLSSDFRFVSEDFNLLFRGSFQVLTNETFILVYLVILGLVFMVVGIVYVTEAIRKIPIQYARRVGAAGGKSNYLPLKINQAGVIPVIFASAILTFPQIIGQLLTSASDAGSTLYNIGNAINNSFLVTAVSSTSAFNTQNYVYYQALYFIMIVAFTFFYTFVTYKPSETADNLKKSGGFIPGLRPGRSTQKYITEVLIRLSVVGALFLATIALLPNIVRFLPQGQNISIFTGIGGTSLLIVVGVTLDTIRQMKSLRVTQSYDQYK